MNEHVNEPSTPSLAIDVDRLCKNYRDGFLWRRAFPALRDVSFQVHEGEVFGLLGPNGAGKTTFLKLLLGIIRKTSGRATMLSYAAGSRRGRRLVGYLPEQLRIPRHLTGHSALDFYGRMSTVPRSEIRARRDSLLELVGLSGRGQDAVTKYSKGMLQRLGLAQALLHQPRLLVLDEPTDGLDPRARAEMRASIRQLQKQGVTVFLNSHLLQEVELVCDRVAILDRGQLRYCGSVKEIGEFVNRRGGRQRLRVTFHLAGPPEPVEAAIGQLPTGLCQIETIKPAGDHVLLIADFEGQDSIDRCVDELRRHSISIRQLMRETTTLEDAFLRILDDPDQAPPV